MKNSCFIMEEDEGGNFVRNYRGELIPIIWFTYTGADGEVIDEEATHIFVQARVIRARAFLLYYNIVEVICHENVEKIEQDAFDGCKSLRQVRMPGVKIVEEGAFIWCETLEDVECNKLEIIEKGAFERCRSLRIINLPSARIVRRGAFRNCKALTKVKFGSKLERIEESAFLECTEKKGRHFTQIK